MYGLICTPPYQIGFLGSCYFIGVLFTIIPIPALSDLYGRHKIFVFTMVIQIVVQILLIFNNSLKLAYFYMILCGMTFAGKNIVGFNLILEFMHNQSWQESVILFYMFVEPIFSGYLTCYYKFISKNWLPLHLQYLALAIINTALVAYYVPESPRFLFSQGLFGRARASILRMAEFNGVSHDDDSGTPLKNFRFEKEIALMNLLRSRFNRDSDLSPVEEINEIKDEERSLVSAYVPTPLIPSIMPSESVHNSIGASTYKWNVLKMAIMWSSSSFSYTLMQMFNKYIGGSLFFNIYLDTLAGILGVITGSYLYSRF